MVESELQKNTFLQKTENNIIQDLSIAIRIAIGNKSIESFAKASRLNVELIDNILNQRISNMPDKNILRSISRVSENRITYNYLCYICGYERDDVNENKAWMAFFPERGDIYYVDLGYNMDSEQNGIRPCVVIQNNKGNENASIVQVAPITSKKKQLLPSHVFLTKEDGMREDSIVCLEQIKSVSKRRLFHNGQPKKILRLSKEKIFEVDVAIEKQLGLIDIVFDEDYASKLVEQLKILESNIKTKKSKDLISLLNEKADKFVEYCSKYRKNPSFIMQKYSNKSYYSEVI